MRPPGHYRRKGTSHIGNVMRALRRREHLSQRELGARIGVHENTIVRLERHPEKASLDLVATAFMALNEPDWTRPLRFAKKQQDMVAPA